jgi:flagellar basal-body rod modification protein FlgD
MDVISAVKSTGTTTNTAEETASKKAVDTQDRFLKLLVAQMQNQDPMNPMDNAQVTSQMAQIQTVSGVSTLDNSIKSLANQFTQMQALQSVSLVGREVSVEGNRLQQTNGVGEGSYALNSPADAVKLEVLSPAGAVVDTVQLGAQGTGRHDFKWASDKYADDAGLKFRITATKGTAAVTSTLYAQDKVLAVNTTGTSLKLQLQNAGLVDYASVKTFD